MISADDAVAQLRPGMTVFVGGASGEPPSLRAALVRNPGAAAGIRFVLAHLPGINDLDYAGLHPTASSLGPFVTPAQRASFEAGRHRLLHASYLGFSRHLETIDIDVALLCAAAAGPDGALRFSPNADFASVVAERARLVLAEIAEEIPAGGDAPAFPASRVRLVAGTEPLLVQPPDSGTSAEVDRIADHVAGLIRDGDCLQVGIGRVPNLILARLHGHRRLGLHSGLVSDECLRLIEAGIVTGEEKTIDRGLAVAGSAVGTHDLYRAAGRAFALRPASYTHGPQVLGRIANLVSINSALEVDLFGQVNATHAGARLVSGPGGFPDFARGVATAPGGRAIVALPASWRGRSRIVPGIGAGVPVTATALDVGFVVTEFGVADLRHTEIGERARRLVAIADPDHREALLRDWDTIRRRL